MKNIEAANRRDNARLAKAQREKVARQAVTGERTPARRPSVAEELEVGYRARCFAARKDTITLSKGGTNERTVKVSSIDIPDLWHIANDLQNVYSRQAILDVWHLAHDLKNELLARIAEAQ